jgi:hypothetical protein
VLVCIDTIDNQEAAMYKIQPAPIPDHITDDGETLSRRPYPIMVDRDGFTPVSGAQDIAKVIGFVRDLAKHQIDVRWHEVSTDPDSPYYPVGMYVIVQNRAGQWATLSTAVDTFEER